MRAPRAQRRGGDGGREERRRPRAVPPARSRGCASLSDGPASVPFRVGEAEPDRRPGAEPAPEVFARRAPPLRASAGLPLRAPPRGQGPAREPCCCIARRRRSCSAFPSLLRAGLTVRLFIPPLRCLCSPGTPSHACFRIPHFSLHFGSVQQFCGYSPAPWGPSLRSLKSSFKNNQPRPNAGTSVSLGQREWGNRLLGRVGGLFACIWQEECTPGTPGMRLQSSAG